MRHWQIATASRQRPRRATTLHGDVRCSFRLNAQRDGAAGNAAERAMTQNVQGFNSATGCQLQADNPTRAQNRRFCARSKLCSLCSFANSSNDNGVNSYLQRIRGRRLASRQRSKMSRPVKRGQLWARAFFCVVLPCARRCVVDGKPRGGNRIPGCVYAWLLSRACFSSARPSGRTAPAMRVLACSARPMRSKLACFSARSRSANNGLRSVSSSRSLTCLRFPKRGELLL